MQPTQLEVLVREPASSGHATPVLFVHGAWHGAWCWDEHFLPYFAEHGYRAVALSLRGHGASAAPRHFRLARIRDYVADVAQVAATLDPAPVVVGHSMGGLVVQKYLESHRAPGAILLASAPPNGVLRTTINVARKHPLRFTRVNLTWSLYPIVATPKLARENLFTPDLPDERVQAYFKRLQDEAYLAYLDMLAFDLPRPKRVHTPMLVLGGERDAIFTPREVVRTARAYSAETKLFPGMAHDMMLEPRWQDVADAMLGWLDARGLTRGT
jgi:pimeloyl-ACP methyl ester carboxylesterase